MRHSPARAFQLLLVSVALSGLSGFPLTSAAAASGQPMLAAVQGQTGPAATQPAAARPFRLEDGTPIKLRIQRTVSSASAQVDERVDFDVLEEIKVNDVVVIPKGSVAWGTVTEAQPKRRMGRGGKLAVNIDAVRLADGEKAPLRAVKDVKGGGHTGAMTGAMVATGIMFFPAAPLFLFMHGKDITIPKGTEITAYINGDLNLIETAFRSIRDADAPATRDEKGTALTGAEPGKKGESEQTVPGREELPKAASSAPKVNVMDPAPTAAGSVAEVTESPITVRGVASDEHGIRGVQVSGQQARIEASGDIRAVQFSYSGVELQEGLNRIPVVATNVNDQRTQVVLSVWLRKTPSAQSPRKGLSESDIVDLLENYVPPQRVAAVAREKGIDFAVSSRVEERLRKAGADDALIRTLRELSPKE